jgi:hypothetical protein
MLKVALASALGARHFARVVGGLLAAMAIAIGASIAILR